jgi:hypothetical protein
VVPTAYAQEPPQNTMQATWDARLAAMQEAFSEVKAKDTKNRDAATRAVEWTRFQRAFNSDIPGTDLDAEMMTHARERLEQLGRIVR